MQKKAIVLSLSEPNLFLQFFKVKTCAECYRKPQKGSYFKFTANREYYNSFFFLQSKIQCHMRDCVHEDEKLVPVRLDFLFDRQTYF